MRAGKLKHPIIIQEVTETQSETGAPAETWSTFAEVWAAIEPLRGREFFASKQIQAEVTTRIRIRYLEGITPKMRVLWGERIYLIDAIIDLEERHREMQLMCREVI
jgi:SPP1 family predicted phage head-tail adaptor